MMDSDKSHLHASKEEIENLVLDDPLNDNNKSISTYRSAMSSLSETHHPLAAPIIEAPADSDPLLTPPYRDLRNPNAGDNSYVDPPSYTDVIFSPFDGNDVNGIESSSKSIENSGSFSRWSSSLSSEYLKIMVSNPHKKHENKFYRVKC